MITSCFLFPNSLISDLGMGYGLGLTQTGNLWWGKKKLTKLLVVIWDHKTWGYSSLGHKSLTEGGVLPQVHNSSVHLLLKTTARFYYNYLFIYFWLCWVFVSVRGLSIVAASGGHSSSRCAGLSLSWPLLLRSTGSRHAGSVIVAHGPSCSAACGIFPGQGSNPCALHWQADSQPLRHQGSPARF